MNRRGQMKIQEMAFVLIAIIVFFSMVALVYFSIRLSTLQTDVTTQREIAAKETVRKLADIPEFSWSGCPGCIDTDKVFVLKSMKAYKNFWNLDYLAVVKTYPNATRKGCSGASCTIECTAANYPDCNTITLINNTNINSVDAYVSLCRFEPGGGGYDKCEMGKIYASAKAIAQ